MAKDQVYSWRVSSETKAELERAAKSANRSVGALLESIVRDWLARSNGSDEAEQKRLHAAAERCFGVLRGGDPHRAENARRIIRERLASRYGRKRPD